MKAAKAETCRLCGAPNDTDGAVCNACKGLQSNSGKPRIPMLPPKPVPCRRCGTPVTPYRHGGLTVKSLCRQCLSKAVADRRPQSSDPNVLMVDMAQEGFSSMAPTVRAWIMRKAAENLRTFGAQILYCILEAMRRDEQAS